MARGTKEEVPDLALGRGRERVGQGGQGPTEGLRK